MADRERNWFRRVLAGTDAPPPDQPVVSSFIDRLEA